MAHQQIQPLDPEIEELISSNQEPSASQRTTLEHVLTERDGCLRDIDATIQELQIQRERVHREVFGIRGALSPLRAMPSELLCRVWHYFIEDFGTKRDKLSGKPPQLTIAHVCSKWREVIFEDGRFWTKWDLSFTDSLLNRSEDALRLWCERSRPFSVDLELLPRPRHWDGDDDSDSVDSKINVTVGGLSEILSPHISRVKSLSLIHNNANRAILSSTPDFSSLETLVYDAPESFTEARVARVSFLDAQQLRSFKLVYFDYSFFTGRYFSQFPYGQMTKLSINSPSYTPRPALVLRTVLLCRRLNSCTLKLNEFGIDWSGQQDLLQPVGIFPDLVHLSLHGFYALKGVAEFLRFIIAPKLESLSLKPNEHQDSPNRDRILAWNTVGMQRWKTQCGFSLKSFLAQGMNLSVKDLFAFCSSMSTLQDIRVKIRSGGGTDVLQRLQTVGEDGSFLWPSLTSLSLRMEPTLLDIDEFESLLIGLVKSRCLPSPESSNLDEHPRLKAIRFGPVDVDGRGDIDDLERGLDMYRNETLLLWLYRVR